MIVTSVGSKYAYCVCMQSGQLESKASTPACWLAKGFRPYPGIDILQAIERFMNHCGGLSAIATKELLTLKEKEMDVKKATTKELVEYHNEHAEKPVKKFADRATAEKRVEALLKKAPKTSEKQPPRPSKAKATQTPKEEKKVSSSVAVVVVEGKKRSKPAEFRSVLKAFQHFNLPVGRHKAFRAALKKAGVSKIEVDGTTYEFTVAV